MYGLSEIRGVVVSLTHWTSTRELQISIPCVREAHYNVSLKIG